MFHPDNITSKDASALEQLEALRVGDLIRRDEADTRPLPHPFIGVCVIAVMKGADGKHSCLALPTFNDEEGNSALADAITSFAEEQLGD